jgi:hypothetical protein
MGIEFSDYRRMGIVAGWTPRVRFKELIEMMVKSDEADVRASLQGRAPAV